MSGFDKLTTGGFDMLTTEKIISIFGTAKVKPGDSVYEAAYRTGKLLAGAGFVIANGGYSGTMLAAAKGATEAGGKTIGVTCSAFGGASANKYIGREIVTGSLDERLDTLIKLGEAYVVLAGGTGTLLELAKVWELKNKGFLNRNKPLILVGEFWKPLVDLVAADDPDSRRFVQFADGPERIMDFLVSND